MSEIISIEDGFIKQCCICQRIKSVNGEYLSFSFFDTEQLEIYKSHYMRYQISHGYCNLCGHTAKEEIRRLLKKRIEKGRLNK